jgi:hypothetical protein
VVERKAKRGRTPGRLVPQEGLELDTVVYGSAGKRRRDDDDRNDRNSKRSAERSDAGVHGRRRKWK